MLTIAVASVRRGPGVVAYLALALFLFMLASLLTGCSAAGNTPYGSFDLRTPTLFDKSTKVRTTKTTGESEEVECEGGVCRTPPR